MMREVYRYRFNDSVLPEDVEAALVLAIFGVEALHGEAQARLDARHVFDPSIRSCVIDASTVVGRHLNRLFAGYLSRELDADQFTVKRFEATVPTHAAVA